MVDLHGGLYLDSRMSITFWPLHLPLLGLVPWAPEHYQYLYIWITTEFWPCTNLQIFYSRKTFLNTFFWTLRLISILYGLLNLQDSLFSLSCVAQCEWDSVAPYGIRRLEQCLVDNSKMLIQYAYLDLGSLPITPVLIPTMGTGVLGAVANTEMYSTHGGPTLS